MFENTVNMEDDNSPLHISVFGLLFSREYYVREQGKEFCKLTSKIGFSRTKAKYSKLSVNSNFTERIIGQQT